MTAITLFINVITIQFVYADHYFSSLNTILPKQSKIAVLQLYEGSTGNITALGELWRDRLQFELKSNHYKIAPRKNLSALIEEIETFGDIGALDQMTTNTNAQQIILGDYYIFEEHDNDRIELYLSLFDSKNQKLIEMKKFKLPLPGNWKVLNNNIRGNRYTRWD